MQMLEVIIGIGSLIVGVIGTAIPFIFKVRAVWKAWKQAKNDAEKEAAMNDMLQAVNSFILQAESAYYDVNTILKGQGKSSGSAKKATVMTDLKSYALGKGYKVDEEYWSAKIDEIVKLTREVNAIKKAS